MKRRTTLDLYMETLGDLESMTAQRDALLAAAEYFLDAADHSQSDPERFFNAQSALRAAIARAKGETK